MSTPRAVDSVAAAEAFGLASLCWANVVGSANDRTRSATSEWSLSLRIMISCYLSLPDLILNRKGRKGRKGRRGRRGWRRGTQRISSAYLCDVLCVPLRLNLLAKES